MTEKENKSTTTHPRGAEPSRLEENKADVAIKLNCIKQQKLTNPQTNQQTSRHASMKFSNAVLSSLAAIGLSSSHVRAEHLRGLSATMATIDHDREGTLSHRELSTDAPHCPTGNSLYFDTFTTSDEGWTPSTRTDYEHSLGFALGPFGTGSESPTKTYDVNSLKDQDYLHAQFDLVKLDSWDWGDDWGYDSVVLSVGDQSIDLENIRSLNDGGTLSGDIADKVWWSVTPRTDEIELENTNERRTDVIHVVSLVVANELFSDGSLTLTLEPVFNQNINDESFAIDNVRVSECGIPEVMICQEREELSIETFSDSNGAWTDEGWNNAKTSDISSLGNFLGRYANSDNEELPSKTYDVGTDKEYALVQFDLLKLDSWDSSVEWGYDTFFLDINGVVIELGNPGLGAMSGTTPNGITWMLQAKTGNGKFAGTSWGSDQIFVMTCYVPAAAILDGDITVILISFLSQEKSDESIGYDNFHVTGYSNCVSD